MKRSPFKRKPSKWGKMGKASPKAKAKLECDALWAKLVKWNLQHCQWCGNTGRTLQAHHLFSRRNGATRYRLDNGIALCGGCHMRAHREPELFRRFLIARVGQGLYDSLFYLSQGTSKPDYLFELIRLRAELAEKQKAPL